MPKKNVVHLLKWQRSVMSSDIWNILQSEELAKHTQISSWCSSIVSNLLSIKTLESTICTEHLKILFRCGEKLSDQSHENSKLFSWIITVNTVSLYAIHASRSLKRSMASCHCSIWKSVKGKFFNFFWKNEKALSSSGRGSEQEFPNKQKN